ncbi:hypothetical protein Taro_027000 [Colocasia esculenta]|uniref:Uncharacterized protein n=1 Tax=Colocasia esculenta TaxID=4460 RepID=A0A843VCT5_COLES|nr:hypothetical protein [Colocasia esculenta]
MSKLQVYADRMSQPSRAVIIFCKVNGIDFEEVEIRLGKRQHQTPQFKEINPMGQVPAIVDGRFKLFERSAQAEVATEVLLAKEYPADVSAQAKINSVLDWHHSNLRRGVVSLIRNTVLAPVLGVPPNPEAAAEGEKLLCSSLSQIESFWLKGNSKFLCGFSRPSIADLSLVCEIMQLEVRQHVCI